MKVTLSKNNEIITSIYYRASEPCTGITVSLALDCLRPRISGISNIDTVISSFISQENINDNKPNLKYIANVNDDVWTIDVETPMCQACGGIEVDNEGDLCSGCR